MLKPHSQSSPIKLKILGANDLNLKDTVEGKAGYFRPAFFTVNFNFDVGSIEDIF